MRQAERLAFLGGDPASGQHHLGGAAGADDARDPDRRPAADEDAALALGELVDRARLGDPHMGGCSDFQPAPHHRSLHGGDDGDPAELHQVERAVPVARRLEGLDGIALLVLRQIEPGAEMAARAAQHHRPRFLRHRLEEAVYVPNQPGVDRVTLLRPVDGENRDRPPLLEPQHLAFERRHVGIDPVVSRQL